MTVVFLVKLFLCFDNEYVVAKSTFKAVPLFLTNDNIAQHSLSFFLSSKIRAFFLFLEYVLLFHLLLCSFFDLLSNAHDHGLSLKVERLKNVRRFIIETN